MNIFSEVKEHLTARQAAEYYGLKVKRNGTTCCPFHDDKHPSMKIDKNYHCFACGVGGDAIDYVSRMFGLSQYDAALKLIDDVNHFLIGKPPDIIFSEDYAQMLHAEPLINYWLDILCMGEVSERQELFLMDRKKVEEIAGKVCAGRKRIMGCSRGSA